MERSLFLLVSGSALATYQFAHPVCCLVILVLASCVATIVARPLTIRRFTRETWLDALAWAQLGAVLGAGLINHPPPRICGVSLPGAFVGAFLILLIRLTGRLLLSSRSGVLPETGARTVGPAETRLEDPGD